jgi:hypothetical protein
MLSHRAHYLGMDRIACRAAAAARQAAGSAAFLHSEAVASASRENRARLVVSSLCSSACAASQRVPSLMPILSAWLPHTPRVSGGSQHTLVSTMRQCRVPTDLATDRTLAALRMTSATCSNTLSTWCWSMFWYSSIASITTWLRSFMGPIGVGNLLVFQ